MNGWIGVDLDGTLAHYDGWTPDHKIGDPIPKMVERVRRWIAEGYEVRIFTARVGGPNPEYGETERDVEEARIRIVEWCVAHLGRPLQVTCMKDHGMIELWDDRAVQVEKNTGEALVSSTRGLS